jgi:predicted amidohydrolase
MPLICYDLRFPVWSKNTFSQDQYGYDLLVYVANWPQSRSHVWRSLLVARAIENQSYVAGVNRIGDDGQGTSHSGDSLVIDPQGSVLAASETGTQAIISATLSKPDLDNFRAKFPFGQDWDHFTLEM